MRPVTSRVPLGKALILIGAFLAIVCAPMAARHAKAADSRIKGLFLGDNGLHRPIERAADLLAPLAKSGIDLAYTDSLDDLTPENLRRFDFLLIYANHEHISAQQEQALLDYVESGGALVGVHCASYCFLNSPRYIALLGGQFHRHGAGVFRSRIVLPNHPAMSGVDEFEAWDETYQHHKLSDDRTVLMVRDDGDRQEPWTWTRRQGQGRVFYTASGHDERTFRLPAFHRLIVQGIRWAVDRVEYAPPVSPPARQPALLPNYVRNARWGTTGDPINDMQVPLSPAESMKHISTPGGFEVQLFASEPDIVKPVAITWDDRGRAWIAETFDYPNDLQPPGQGNDRITICEDTDGDRSADKFTVFADKLSIPTSLVHAAGGLIVAQAPDMLFLQDTDGDDRADVRRVLFTGFGTDDTHAGPSNLRLGFDDWIYATVGYSGFDGTVGNESHSFRQGLFRFKTDGSRLEFLSSTSNNTWGLGIDESGEIVYSTANGEHSSHLAIPNRQFESVRGWLARGTARMADHEHMHPLTTIRQVDHHDGFTAAAGHAVYTARQFPADYWNRIAFITEPTGHLVHMCLLEPRGSGYVARDRFNFFASTDEWTAPIVAEVGPDGAVWILDWYNYVVQHNPIPPGFQKGKGNAYVTDLRDKRHGRIYRVVNASAPLSQSYDLTAMSGPELVDVLRSDNLLWRLKAARRLIDRGDSDVLRPLAQLVVDAKSSGGAASLSAAAHALYVMHALGAFSSQDASWAALPAKALAVDDPAVRKAALAVLPRTDRSRDALLASDVLDDPDGTVRRAALLALGDMPTSETAGQRVAAFLRLRSNLRDRWLPLAGTSAAAKHWAGFLIQVMKTPSADSPDDHLGTGSEDAPLAARLQEVITTVAGHAARTGAGAHVSTLLSGFATGEPRYVTAALAGLEKNWPADSRPALSERDLQQLSAIVERLPSDGQLSLVNLATRWGAGDRVRAAVSALLEQSLLRAADTSLDEPSRIEAAARFVALNPDEQQFGELLSLISPKSTPSLNRGLLAAAGRSTRAELVDLLLQRWRGFTPALRQQTVDLLLQRPEWTQTLLQALEDGRVATTELGLEQSQQLARYPDEALARRAQHLLSQGGGLPDPNRAKILEELLPVTQSLGSAEQGAEVFKKNCGKCHRHGEIGERIGPDLTGFAVHPPEKLLTEILDPNRSVEGNYRQYTIITLEGRVYNGLLSAETRTALELIDSEAKKHTILREDIDEFVATNRSIMPEGFEKQLNRDDFRNLLAFLTAKGKYVPVPLDKVATAISTRPMFGTQEGGPDQMVFSNWEPKHVGEVPFQLVDPRDGRVPNAILLYGPLGNLPPRMPESVVIPCNAATKAVHFLSGVSGWGHPVGERGTVSMIVRLHYADGTTEDHPLLNGVHFADYIRRVDVPGSKFAFALRNQQLRYLAIEPKRDAVVQQIELLKGDDQSAPIVMAVTVETR